MTNIYVESYISCANKRNHKVCGDYSIISRNSNSTDFILSDGMGSGLTANISAIACASRLNELLKQDIPITRAGEKIVELMKRARTESIPFATFTLVRIQRNGQFTILNYENPHPILINNGIVQPVNLRHFTVSQEILSEANGTLNIGDSIILSSDGVSQAGLGILPNYGWGTEGLVKYIKNNLNRNKSMDILLDKILYETYKLSGNLHADDTTIVALTARASKELNIISGPPVSKEHDVRFTRAFMNAYGKKVICGSSTSDMVARISGRKLHDVKISTSFTQPPKYFIEGIDLVTEGAITLNQVYNILDEDPSTYDKNSCVSELANMLLEADEIKFYMGMARNEGHSDISFKQMGVLPRRKIIPLISDKLSDMDKLVTIEKM